MTAPQFFIFVVVVVSLSLLLAYVYRDYRRHKKPLETVDPHVAYSLAHHVRVVTIPILKYRVRVSVEKGGHSLIRRI